MVLLYVIVCFKLIPNTSKLYRLLLGLISGIGFQVFSFIVAEIFNKTIIKAGNSVMSPV
jgi:uncharacterized membrane protein